MRGKNPICLQGENPSIYGKENSKALVVSVLQIGGKTLNICGGTNLSAYGKENFKVLIV